MMNRQLVDRVAEAVLYEGYILYPYRPSLKNRQRWTFGGLFPRSYCEAHAGSDAWTMQTECLVLGSGQAQLEVHIRFLQLQARLVGQIDPPLSDWTSAEDPPYRVVDSLRVGEKLWQTWQEGTEREVSLEADLARLVSRPLQHDFVMEGRRQREWLRTGAQELAGVLIREQQALSGTVTLSAGEVEDGLFKLRVQICNRTPLEGADQLTRDEAALHALVATHTILGVRDGEFVSLIDPPLALKKEAAACSNCGTWPVLVGETGARHTMLSAPIILYDYPQLAAESRGNFFDASEIDEMLALRILTLSEDEKKAMAAVDERARALLERTETLGLKGLAELHGVVTHYPKEGR
jgi:hypothetical protein